MRGLQSEMGPLVRFIDRLRRMLSRTKPKDPGPRWQPVGGEGSGVWTRRLTPGELAAWDRQRARQEEDDYLRPNREKLRW
jgi:hypothetical protein